MFYTLEQSEQEDRNRKAQRILDIGDELDQIYARLEYFDNHGILPQEVMIKKREPKKPSVLSAAELVRRQITLRTYVSRYERLTRNSKNPETLARNQSLMDQYRQELNEVNKMMK